MWNISLMHKWHFCYKHHRKILTVVDCSKKVSEDIKAMSIDFADLWLIDQELGGINLFFNALNYCTSNWMSHCHRLASVWANSYTIPGTDSIFYMTRLPSTGTWAKANLDAGFWEAAIVQCSVVARSTNFKSSTPWTWQNLMPSGYLTLMDCNF